MKFGGLLLGLGNLILMNFLFVYFRIPFDILTVIIFFVCCVCFLIGAREIDKK